MTYGSTAWKKSSWLVMRVPERFANSSRLCLPAITRLTTAYKPFLAESGIDDDHPAHAETVGNHAKAGREEGLAELDVEVLDRRPLRTTAFVMTGGLFNRQATFGQQFNRHVRFPRYVM